MPDNNNDNEYNQSQSTYLPKGPSLKYIVRIIHDLIIFFFEIKGGAHRLGFGGVHQNDFNAFTGLPCNSNQEMREKRRVVVYIAL